MVSMPGGLAVLWHSAFCLDTVRVLLLLDVLRQLSLLPNVFAYGAPVSACGKGSMPVWAVQRFDEMLQDELQPNVITCTALLSSCGMGSMPVWAVQCFDEMLLDELQANVITRTAWLNTRGKGQ